LRGKTYRTDDRVSFRFQELTCKDEFVQDLGRAVVRDWVGPFASLDPPRMQPGN
jgi:hypothetical protein